MKRTRFIFLVIFSFVFYSISYTQELPDIIDWMPVHQSTQGGAMGRTSIACARDASIVFSNPGGIAFLNDYSISGAYYPSFNNISYFSFGHKVKNNNYICLNHQRYNETNQKKHYGYGMAMCRRISDFGIGINIKVFQFKDLLLRDKTYFRNATDKDAITFDLGTMYYKNCRYKNIPVIGNVTGGISISNILGKVKVPNKKTIKLPSFLRIGYSFSMKSLKQKKGLSLLSFAHSFEYVKTINNAYYSSTGIGFEMGLYEIIYGRFGYYRRNRIIKGSTSGIGLSLPFNHFFKNLPIILQYNYGRYLYEYYPREYIKAHSVNIIYRLNK